MLDGGYGEGYGGGWRGEWLWRCLLLAWEEESGRECVVLLHNIVLQENVHDAWRWLLDPIHGYSVRGAYRFLTTSGETVDRTPATSGINIFLQRCLCSCGASFALDFP